MRAANIGYVCSTYINLYFIKVNVLLIIYFNIYIIDLRNNIKIYKYSSKIVQ